MPLFPPAKSPVICNLFLRPLRFTRDPQSIVTTAQSFHTHWPLTMAATTLNPQVNFSSLSQLQNTRILILGGTSGMGFAIASVSLAHGARVTISSSSATKLSSALTRLRNTPPSPLLPTKDHDVSGETCDLSQPENIEGNLRHLFDSIGEKVNHVAVTAGDAFKITPIHEATVDYIQRAGTVRFLGALMLGKLAPQYLVPGAWSLIAFPPPAPS